MSKRMLIGWRIKKCYETLDVWVQDNQETSTIEFDHSKGTSKLFTTRKELYSCLLTIAIDASYYPNERMTDIKIVRVYKRAKS
jgi:hypothetical protein